MYRCTYMCICVYVYERERQREKERQRETGKEEERVVTLKGTHSNSLQ